MTNPIAFNAALLSPETETIIEAQRVARDVYDERDDDGQRRDLHFHEQVFLTELSAIARRYAESCGAARRDPNQTAETIDILCRLALRTEAREMGDALRAYRAAREEFYNFEVEAVGAAMQAAE